MNEESSLLSGKSSGSSTIGSLTVGFTKIGVALANVFKYESASLLSLKLANKDTSQRIEQHLANGEEKLSDIEQSDISQIPAALGLPIIDNLLSLEQNSLSDAFVNLLIKGATFSTLGMVHPAYIKTLENLSVDEAAILYHLKDASEVPFIELNIKKYRQLVSRPDDMDSETPKTRDQLLAQINYTFQDKSELTIDVDRNLMGLEGDVNLLFKDNIDMYVENISRLGLVKFTRNQYSKSSEPVYEKLERYYADRIDSLEDMAKKFNEKGEDNWKLEIVRTKGFMSFTEYGKAFLEASIKPIKKKD